MKHIALFVMSILLKKAKREKIGKELIIQRAYDGMIDSYEITIMFIKANIKGTSQTKSEKSYSAIDWNELN
jgi:hypothetical protein